MYKSDNLQCKCHASHALYGHDPRLAQMAGNDEDELLRQIRAQHRSVSFLSKTELAQIDLADESHTQNEDVELNETV